MNRGPSPPPGSKTTYRLLFRSRSPFVDVFVWFQAIGRAMRVRFTTSRMLVTPARPAGAVDRSIERVFDQFVFVCN